MSTPTLSIIITAHHEGNLAHATILSVLTGLERVEEKFEIVINLDSPDQPTSKYYARYSTDQRFKFNRTNYGEPASARNAGIALARGKYITVLDGDDLLSENYFEEFMRFAQKHAGELYVVHPGATVQFGKNRHLTAWPQFDSITDPVMTFRLVGTNTWSQTATAPATVFKKTSYPPSVNGFGYEDWWWNSETYAKGCRHYVIDSTLFYRRKTKESIFDTHESSHAVVAYTSLLSASRVKSLPLPSLETTRDSVASRTKNLAKKSLKTATSIPVISIPARFIAQKAGKTLASKRFNALPKFVHANWQAISKIEPDINYSPTAAEHICYQSYEDDTLGLIYRHLVETISARPVDCLYLVPSRLPATARKAIQKSLEHDRANHPDWHIVSLSDPKAAIPDIEISKFHSLTRKLSDSAKSRLFSRLIIQLETKNIVVAHDKFFLGWIRDHSELLVKNHYKVKEITHAADN